MKTKTLIALLAIVAAPAVHPEVALFPEVAAHCLKNGTEWIEPTKFNGGMGSGDCYALWVKETSEQERSAAEIRAGAGSE